MMKNEKAKRSMKPRINKGIPIEELVEILPTAVSYLAKQGIRCIACGEPIWGTLEEAARDNGFGDREIKVFVADLNQLAQDQEGP
jgi:methionine synthase II (cobalamin-independent)